jgi:hypothetical protein
MLCSLEMRLTQDRFEFGAVIDEIDEDEDEFHGDKSKMNEGDLVGFDDLEEEDFKSVPGSSGCRRACSEYCRNDEALLWLILTRSCTFHA